jgi:hypothetical protein
VKVSDPAGGDLSGTYPNPSLRIFGLPLQSGASPTSGQVLAFDGSAWTPTTPAGGGVADHGTLTGLTDDDHPQYLLADGVRPLAGNLNAGGNRITGLGAGTVAGDAVRFEQAVKLGDGAGGDLTGAYPNPLVKLWGLSLRAGASPTSGQVIAFDGSTWTPMTAGGDLSGRYDNLRVTRLLDSPVSGTIQPITGQVLTFDGSAWAPATPAGGSASDHGGLTGLTDDDHPQYVLADGARPLTGNLNAGGNRISGLGDGTVAGDAVRFEQAVKVTDPAGGDLSGTYPNLRVTKLVNAPVSTTAASPTSGQVLAFDGSAWTPTTPAGAGGPGLGAWDDNRNLNTTYQAATDGFVVVRIASSCGGIEGRTGSNPNSSAVRGFVKEPGSFTMPVRKGDYWMAQENGGCTAFLYWISLGS